MNHSKKELTKENILKYFCKEDGTLIGARCTEKYFKDHGWLEAIQSYYVDSLSTYETLYRILNDISVRPICKICGKPVKFNKSRGFAKWCSPKCRNNDPEILAKNKIGVSKGQKEAYKERGDEIKAKRASTLKEKYNINSNSSSPFAVTKFQDKAKQTIFDKYGVTNTLKLSENHQKSLFTLRQKSIELQKKYGYDIEYLKNGNILVHNGCKIHGDIEISPGLFNNRTMPDRRNHQILCPICNPIRNTETSIETIIKNILLKYNINFNQHNRQVIHPKELDFYLPDYKIGIECNGLYWHSGETNKYNQQYKYEACKKVKVQLLSFWEDDIIDKKDIIENILKSHFGLNQKIYARKCQINKISSKESKDFLNQYHLQGSINASIRLGLFYQDELVEVMTFGKLRNNVGEHNQVGFYELYRLCSKGGITIVGGASKLFKYFIKNYNPIKIISFCHNDISNGNVYKQLGMQLENELKYSYTYWNKNFYRRFNRYTIEFNTDKIIPKEEYDTTISRKQNLINHGFFRCYGTGTCKYVWKNLNYV